MSTLADSDTLCHSPTTSRTLTAADMQNQPCDQQDREHEHEKQNENFKWANHPESFSCDATGMNAEGIK